LRGSKRILGWWFHILFDIISYQKQSVPMRAVMKSISPFYLLFSFSIYSFSTFHNIFYLFKEEPKKNDLSSFFLPRKDCLTKFYFFRKTSPILKNSWATPLLFSIHSWYCINDHCCSFRFIIQILFTGRNQQQLVVFFPAAGIYNFSASSMIERTLPDDYRTGFFISDGAGVVKGRIVSEINFENY
jgi:hypothetical protein